MAKPKRTEKREYVAPDDREMTELIADAQAAFYDDPNVIGVGFGDRRVKGETRDGEHTLIVYVKNKLPKEECGDRLLPPEFEGVAIDVVAPFGADAPREALGFAESHQISDDMSFVDWARLHEQRLEDAGGEIAWHGTVQDFGDVCLIEDDGSLVDPSTQQVDFAQAYKLFRTTHPDIYDFVTFFTDTASGMPPQGGSSWYRFVFNDTQGIGFGPFNQRASYGSNVLQGIMFLNQGHFPQWQYVMLQEQGHRWGCFARYRDSQTGSNQNDHLLGGWGHWAAKMDDDRSPMDYDIYDWVASNGDFRRESLLSEERGYCNLDLYLMGLLGPHEVGDFSLLNNLSPISGNLYSADEKELTVENIVLAEGPRIPDVATSQKLFKNGFVVLTKDISASHDLVEEVDLLRLRFEEDFSEGTKNLGRVDTTLGPVRAELTPSQVGQLTNRGYTSLHRHIVGPKDLRITGTQFRGALDPGQSQRWFTYNWSPAWVVDWSVQPTVTGGKVTWSQEIERTSNGRLTYWITVRNVGAVRTKFDAKYALLR